MTSPNGMPAKAASVSRFASGRRASAAEVPALPCGGHHAQQGAHHHGLLHRQRQGHDGHAQQREPEAGDDLHERCGEHGHRDDDQLRGGHGGVDAVLRDRLRQQVGHLGGHAVRGDGHAAADRLADHEEVGVEAPRPRGAAGSDADRVRLVDDEQRAVPAGELANTLEVAGLGQDDADVGERRLHEHAGDIAVTQRRLHRVEVVELHHLGGERRVDRRSERAGAGDHVAVGVEHGERLVDRAVVAPVHHEDLRSAREVTAEAEHEPIGVGGGHRDLPHGQTEAAGELLGDPRRVVVRQHGGDAPARLRRERVGHLGEGVARHRAGVAEAEVDVLDAVDVDEARAVGFVEEQRERAGQAGHPRHRNAAEQVCRRGPTLGGRAGVEVDEALLLVGRQGGQTRAIDRGGRDHGCR
jgi:hypothetical protein